MPDFALQCTALCEVKPNKFLRCELAERHADDHRRGPDYWGDAATFGHVNCWVECETLIAERIAWVAAARTAAAWDDGYATGQTDHECRATNPHRAAQGTRAATGAADATQK